jgi:hypothetical protein
MVNEPGGRFVETPVIVRKIGRTAMRYVLVTLCLLLASVFPARAQVSVGVGVTFPGVQIGVNVPAYPELVVVPGYPVYYAPYAEVNYFFYDGVYWVYQGDHWYASSWYNGPWRIVRPEHVPLYVLRVPVRYYRAPPPYFRGWHGDAPPRWGEHWGRGWERRHPGWDRWDQRRAPRPAPLPAYQRQYMGDRYPHAMEQQHAIRAENYRYRPRETAAREYYRRPGPPGGPRGERQWQGPGPQQPPDRGPMRGAGPRDDGRGRGGAGPRDDGRGRGPAGPQDDGRGRGPAGPQDDGRGRGHDDHGRDRPDRR